MHLGVYAGNHMSVRAVVTMLEKIERSPQIYEQLEKHGDYLEHQLRSMFAEMKRPALVSRIGSLLSVSLLRQPVDLSHGPRVAAQAMDFAAHRALQIRAQRRGVYFHPSPIEPWFLSTAHSLEDLDQRGRHRARRAGRRARVTVSGGSGLEPLQLLRETAARSPRSVLFAEDAGNTTAQALVELVEARLDAYRRIGIGPGCRVGAVAWPAASFTADVLAVLALDAVVAPLPRQMSEWERERTEALVSGDAPGRAARLAAAARNRRRGGGPAADRPQAARRGTARWRRQRSADLRHERTHPGGAAPGQCPDGRGGELPRRAGPGPGHRAGLPGAAASRLRLWIGGLGCSPGRRHHARHQRGPAADAVARPGSA